jgi:hypothetical protein
MEDQRCPARRAGEIEHAKVGPHERVPKPRQADNERLEIDVTVARSSIG